MPETTASTQRRSAQLVAFAAAILYLELAVIRFSSAQVLYLGYFNNFILISAFVGLGLGFLAAKRDVDLSAGIPFVLLLLFALLLVGEFDADALRNQGGLFFFGNRKASSGLPGIVLLLVLFLVTVALFAALAQQTARLFDCFTPLRAYTLDVVGSLLGIGLFSLQSYAFAGPVTWVITGTLVLVVGYLVSPERLVGRAAAVGLAGLSVVLLLASASPGHRVVWSTYQKLEFRASDTGGLISANGLPHQFLHPTSVSEKLVYRVPFDIHQAAGGKLDRVLIIGAGSGTDLALALALGAKAVDAVEIDAGIVELGRLHHPERPYADPRVTTHITDGRRFLHQTRAKYDLIIFALPDSLVKLSAVSDVRLESYLFTLEALAEAKARLKPDGRLMLYNQYRWQWLREKLALMLEQVFGKPPLRVSMQGNTVFAAGKGVRGPKADASEELRVASDDWPFLYMKRPALHWIFILVIGGFLAFALLGVGALAPRGTLRRPAWPFFFMGAAFLLLETKSISLFSLLFGTTWLVNSLAFAGILTSVLAANLFVARWQVRRRWVLFAGLFGALALAYVIPAKLLLGVDPAPLRYAVALALVFAPIFFANLIFSREFRDTGAATRAFGWNMLGAVAGGGLEYLALLLGQRNLLWIVAAAYLLTSLLLARGDASTSAEGEQGAVDDAG